LYFRRRYGTDVTNLILLDEDWGSLMEVQNQPLPERMSSLVVSSDSSVGEVNQIYRKRGSVKNESFETFAHVKIPPAYGDPSTPIIRTFITSARDSATLTNTPAGSDVVILEISLPTVNMRSLLEFLRLGNDFS
jgi:hypothetical protein